MASYTLNDGEYVQVQTSANYTFKFTAIDQEVTLVIANNLAGLLLESANYAENQDQFPSFGIGYTTRIIEYKHPQNGTGVGATDFYYRARGASIMLEFTDTTS